MGKRILFLFTLLMLPLIFFVKVSALDEFSLSETNTYNYVEDYEKNNSHYNLSMKNKNKVGNKVFYLGDGLLNTELYGSWDYDVFLPYNVDISKENIKNGGVWHANVTYMVDDEIYWIDECENGPIEYIPEEPKKDGLSFEGWYKDKDFLTKWDFKIDTVPPIKEIDHGDNWKNTWTEYVYEEVMLYAKFN